MTMTREYVMKNREYSRLNAQKRSRNARRSGLRSSKREAATGFKQLGHALINLLTAIFAVISFVTRDIWAHLGKFLQFLSRKTMKAGNKMDWGDN